MKDSMINEVELVKNTSSQISRSTRVFQKVKKLLAFYLRVFVGITGLGLLLSEIKELLHDGGPVSPLPVVFGLILLCISLWKIPGKTMRYHIRELFTSLFFIAGLASFLFAYHAFTAGKPVFIIPAVVAGAFMFFTSYLLKQKRSAFIEITTDQAFLNDYLPGLITDILQKKDADLICTDIIDINYVAELPVSATALLSSNDTIKIKIEVTDENEIIVQVP